MKISVKWQKRHYQLPIVSPKFLLSEDPTFVQSCDLASNSTGFVFKLVERDFNATYDLFVYISRFGKKRISCQHSYPFGSAKGKSENFCVKINKLRWNMKKWNANKKATEKDILETKVNSKFRKF